MATKRSRRARVASFEGLERRLVLTDVSGAILVDTTWTAANSPYVLTADVFVRQGHTLNVEPGVVIRSSASTNELYVSDDGSGGTLNLNGTSNNKVQVENSLIVGAAGGGALTDVNFTPSSSVTLNAAKGTPLTVSNTAFNGALIVHPEFVPSLPLAGNTFAANTVVQLIGNSVVDADTTWPAIANVSRYEIHNASNFNPPESIYVRSGATLTIAGGVTVNSQQPDLDQLVIGDTGTGGRLVIAGTQAAPVSVQAWTSVQTNASADIHYGTFAGVFSVSSTDSVALDHVTFANTSTVTLNAAKGTPLTVGNTAFNGALIVHPEFVPNLPLNGNTFAANTVVQLIGNTVVDADTTWPVIPNVSRYEIRNASNFNPPESIYVRAGATLTVAAGVTVNSQQPDLDQLVIGDNGTGGKLVIAGTQAAPVSIQAWTTVQTNATADIHYATFPGAFGVSSTDSVALDHVTFSNTSSVTLNAAKGTPLTVSNTAFNGALIVHPEFVPNLPLAGNTFAPNTVVQLIGNTVVDADTTWPIIPNVSRYEIRNASNFNPPESIFVRSGATLTIAAGVTVTSQQPDLDQLVIGDTGTGGKLAVAGTQAAPVSVQAWTSVLANATADIRYGTFAGAFSVSSTDSVALDHVTFANTSTVTLNAARGTPLAVSNTAFNGGLIVHPEFVPSLPLAGNTFAPNTIVQLIGNTVVDADTTWPAIPNVSRYEIRNASNFNPPESVYVRSGATLTIAPGVTVNSQQPELDQLVIGDNGTGGKLAANNATLNTRVAVGAGGGIRYRYVTENALLQLNSAASIDVHLTDFSNGGASVESIGNATVPIDLHDNYWGFTTAALIEANKLVDDSDTPLNSRPQIVFDPFLTATPLDTTPPVLGAFFQYQSPQTLHLVFSEDVRPTFSPGDFALTNVTTHQAVPLTGLAWDSPYTTSATIVFDNNAALPDGDYVLSKVGSIADLSGNAAADFSYSFFVLGGDADRNRRVDFNDLVKLAQNYNTVGSKTWSDGDFNGDRTVDFKDLVILAQRYNTSLGAPGAAAAAMAPTLANSFAADWVAASAPPATELKKPKPAPVFSVTPVRKPIPAKPRTPQQRRPY